MRTGGWKKNAALFVTTLGVAAVGAIVPARRSAHGAVPTSTIASPNAGPTGTTTVQPPVSTCQLQDHIDLTFVPAIASPLVVGLTATVSATASKVAVSNGQPCGEKYVPVPSFAWELALKPTGSTATLAGTQGLEPTIHFDKPGTYRIRFVACPNGCSIPVTHVLWPQGASSGTVVTTNEAFPREVAERDLVVHEVLPPETTAPDSPRPSRATQYRPFNATNLCGDAPGILNPAWVTPDPFRGAADYKLLEGRVLIRSRVSRMDNFFNHASHDINFWVDPDPAYRDLVSTYPEEKWGGDEPVMGVEWETAQVPEGFRPGLGDRVSVYGIHILDCGHGSDGHYYSEIHPPLAIAVHRELPVLIPPTFDFDGHGASVGNAVMVPGIVTDVWVNRHGGELASSPNTGLVTPVAAALSTPLLALISDPFPVAQAVFHFNIYLPRSPQRILAAAGIPVPLPPLYVAVQAHPEAGTAILPHVSLGQLQTDQDAAWVPATIDLSGLGASQQYAARITAAWVYPATDNWGLRAWRAQIKEIDVYNDSETDETDSNGAPIPIPGKWRFWANVNSEYGSWVRIFDCPGGCISDLGNPTRYHVGAAPWRADSTDANGFMPGAIRLFPDQMLRFNASGFDGADNLAGGNDTGNVEGTRPPSVGTWTLKSECQKSGSYPTDSGCGSFSLVFSITDGMAVGPARLSAAATSFMSAYDLSHRGPLPTIQYNPPVAVSERERSPVPGKIVQRTAGEPEEPEAFQELAGDPQALRDLIARSRATKGPALEQALAAWSAILRARAATPSGRAAVLRYLALIKPAIPGDLWNRYFCAIEIGRACP